MNHHNLLAASLILLFLSTLPCPAWPAVDQLEEIRRERTDERHRNQLRELRFGEHIDNLKRYQQLEGARLKLERARRETVDDPQARKRLGEGQRRLDELKNDQQLERVQRYLQFHRIEREQNPLRRQEQIRELQRQQQLDLIRDQAQKLRPDFDPSH